MNEKVDIELNSATAGRLAELCALLDAAGLPAKDLRAEMLSSFIVACRAGTLVGAVGLELFSSVALLRSLVVSPECRNLGLGRRLLEAIESHAQRLGVTELYLLTTTAESFFIEAGYDLCPRETVPESIAQTREFTDICPANAACLSRRL